MFNQKYLFKNSVTSDSYGILGIAPSLVIQMNAAALANYIAFLNISI